MKAKNLDSQTNLALVKVRIPNDCKTMAMRVGLETQEVFLVSSWSAGVWVKTDLTSERRYPLNIAPHEVLEWEVVED